MARLAILPYGPSNSCLALRDALVQRFADVRNISPLLLKSQNSVFMGRRDDIIINYGNRSAPSERFGSAHTINAQSALNNAANKLTALTVMRDAGVSTLPFTTSQAEAQTWVSRGDVVYSRTTLNGHSGEGIVVSDGRTDATSPQTRADIIAGVPQAPLYTKGITGQRREWRIHVFKGHIIHAQVKRRRNGYQELPEYREDVRNHSTGWIYATENMNPNQAVLRNSLLAVQAMGLDFGAVDVISYRDDAWVLEVNTAPGLQADTTMTAYCDAFVEYVNARIEGREGVYTERFTVEEEDPTPPSEDHEPEVEAAEEIQVPVSAPRSFRQETTAPLREVSPASPTMFEETVQNARPGDVTGAENGYYVADLRTEAGRRTTAIVWVSNGRVFRHGWNTPIHRDHLVSLGQRITRLYAGTQELPVNNVGA